MKQLGAWLVFPRPVAAGLTTLSGLDRPTIEKPINPASAGLSTKRHRLSRHI